MEEILHQLIDDKHPIIIQVDRVSTIQGDAGFLPSTVSPSAILSPLDMMSLLYPHDTQYIDITLLLLNMVTENGPFIDHL